MNTTTQIFARKSRGNGYEYAAAIERSRRTDYSGLIIVAVVALIMAAPYLVLAVLP